jgi:hypothetical protein
MASTATAATRHRGRARELIGDFLASGGPAAISRLGNNCRRVAAIFGASDGPKSKSNSSSQEKEEPRTAGDVLSLPVRRAVLQALWGRVGADVAALREQLGLCERALHSLLDEEENERDGMGSNVPSGGAVAGRTRRKSIAKSLVDSGDARGADLLLCITDALRHELCVRQRLVDDCEDRAFRLLDAVQDSQTTAGRSASETLIDKSAQRQPPDDGSIWGVYALTWTLVAVARRQCGEELAEFLQR